MPVVPGTLLLTLWYNDIIIPGAHNLPMHLEAVSSRYQQRYFLHHSELVTKAHPFQYISAPMKNMTRHWVSEMTHSKAQGDFKVARSTFTYGVLQEEEIT